MHATAYHTTAREQLVCTWGWMTDKPRRVCLMSATHLLEQSQLHLRYHTGRTIRAGCELAQQQHPPDQICCNMQ